MMNSQLRDAMVRSLFSEAAQNHGLDILGAKNGVSVSGTRGFILVCPAYSLDHIPEASKLCHYVAIMNGSGLHWFIVPRERLNKELYAKYLNAWELIGGTNELRDDI